MNKLMTVAVIDSGIYPHIDFKNRIVAFKDFVNGRKNAYDDCGHGTHVSGIIAGSGYASHGRIKGICPAARLAGIKVLDRLGNGRIENVLDATDWIISHQKDLNIRIVNISFGATTFGEKENLIALGLDHGKDFQYMAWVHDEVQVACRTKEIAETVVKVAQDSMRQAQDFFGFRVQLDTEGKIGKNWCDCH